MNDKQLTIKHYFDVYNNLKKLRDDYNNAESNYENLQSLKDKQSKKHVGTLEQASLFMTVASNFAGEELKQQIDEQSPFDVDLLIKLFIKMHDKESAIKLYKEANKQFNYIVFNDGEEGEKSISDDDITVADAEADRIIDEIRKYHKEGTVPFFENFSYFYGKKDATNSSMFDGSVFFGLALYDLPCGIPDDEPDKISLRGHSHQPIDLNVLNHQIIYAEYTNDNENIVLDGMTAVIYKIINNLKDSIDTILFADTVRYNNTALGELAVIAGKNDGLLENAPRNNEELRNRLTRLINKKQHDNQKTTFLFLHNFPHGYDSNSVSLIQQIIANADAFNVCAVLTSNISNSNFSSKDAVEFIRSRATSIIYKEDQWFICLEDYGFEWGFEWLEKDDEQINKAIDTVNSGVKKVNLSNIYPERVKLSINSHKKKGTRFLDENAYSVNNQGELLKLDFENTNFATFLCGASRSGKSNLLHIIISDLINNNHPDDIEIWLVDFKMTEFSRYIDNLPPHIRYILLDESPELVYDIVDRLMEILTKRQNIFKGKWDKLANVPADKYMPALFVIIDEFSVMSKIIADSVINANDNYVIKMQTLLAKGAALGMHFIFASQGFTSGSRGLNDFAKKQIQQRIAMKTELSEIKFTLDLQSYSDRDKLLMEELTVYHSLYKSVKPLNYDGDHLIYGKVLYIPDIALQTNFIKELNNYYKPSLKYEPNNDVAYIYKKPLIVDGNAYSTFDNKIEEMNSYINENKEDEKCLLFIGEPRRMMTLLPLSIHESYQENVALLSYLNEKAAAASSIISIMKSLELQNKEYKCFSSTGNQLFDLVKPHANKMNKSSFTSLDDICEQLRTIKKAIERRENLDCYYFVFGIEKLFFDFSFVKNDGLDNESSMASSSEYESRQEGEMDLLTMMSLGVQVTTPDNTQVKVESTFKVKKVYDARDDLKFILTNGPRLGIHFIVPFETVNNFQQMRIDDKLFTHKIFFRSARTDLLNIISSRFASDISELPDRIFRYCNNISAVSFRPYLHAGLEIDGRVIDESGNIVINEEEEYLL